MKTLAALLLLVSPLQAVDVSELAKHLKNECGQCEAWVPILEALEQKTDSCLVDQAAVMRDAEQQRAALAKARTMAKRLKKERKAVEELLSK